MTDAERIASLHATDATLRWLRATYRERSIAEYRRTLARVRAQRLTTPPAAP